MFKPILNYEGIYQINQQSEIYRLLDNGQKRKLTPSLNDRGYPEVCLCKNGKQTTQRVHILLWEAFNGSIPTGYHIHHKDKNRQNCSLENLKLLPKKEHLQLHLDEKTNKSRSQKLKGHTVSEETKRKISEANMNNKHALGHIVSEQARKRMSQAHKGKTLSQQTKAKMRKPHIKRA